MRAMRTVARPSVPAAAGTPVRRVGRVSNTVAKVISDTSKREAETEIKEDLQSIAELQEQLDSVIAAMDAHKQRIQKNLELLKVPGFTDGLWSAELKTSYSRESTVINPEQFHDAVSPEVFWSCIKVQVTEAKKHLAPAELKNISSTSPSEITGKSLLVQRVTNKVKKSKS